MNSYTSFANHITERYSKDLETIQTNLNSSLSALANLENNHITERYSKDLETIQTNLNSSLSALANLENRLNDELQIQYNLHTARKIENYRSTKGINLTQKHLDNLDLLKEESEELNNDIQINPLVQCMYLTFRNKFLKFLQKEETINNIIEMSTLLRDGNHPGTLTTLPTPSGEDALSYTWATISTTDAEIVKCTACQTFPELIGKDIELTDIDGAVINSDFVPTFLRISDRGVIINITEKTDRCYYTNSEISTFLPAYTHPESCSTESINSWTASSCSSFDEETPELCTSSARKRAKTAAITYNNITGEELKKCLLLHPGGKEIILHYKEHKTLDDQNRKKLVNKKLFCTIKSTKHWTTRTEKNLLI
ncbi:hypothetical protein QE152_g33991 [Popillia japonica]|uniref:Uncharacterized protein n=1 Tax=Popillia japonica TaxID=7064 RepID=A0AAW1IVE4_POPJA